MIYRYLAIIFLILQSTFSVSSQQDPQYTQYMYNTQVINPAYVGSREVFSLGLLYRTQWVGLEGAPKSTTLTLDTPFSGFDNMGVGLSVVRDEIGPSVRSNFTIDYSYMISVSYTEKISFGLKGGLDVLDVDFTKLNLLDSGDLFETNIDNKIQPQIGAGLYYNSKKSYVGLSVPNFLTTRHFNGSNKNTSAADRIHYFLIAGYVFDLNNNLKFKPATLVKVVSGSPLQLDFSANFLLYNKLTLGVAYRWNVALSAIAGFQIMDQIYIGFGYDYQTTDIEKYSNGSYEILMRFDLFKKEKRYLTPRFF